MALSMQPLIILDRDGVINEDSDAFVKSPDEWRAIPGSIEAIARFNRAGCPVAIATNQSGIARGLFDLATLTQIHDKMLGLITAAGGRLDALVYCPHGPDDQCTCRKPEPGLMHQIEERLQIPLTNAYVVGDSLRDLQAAEKVGAKPVLVKTGKGLKTITQLDSAGLAEVPVYTDLKQFADFLLDGSGRQD